MSKKAKPEGNLKVIDDRSKGQIFGQLVLKCFDAVNNKMENSWKDFSEKYQKLQQSQQLAQPTKKKVSPIPKKQPNKLRIKVSLKSTAKQSNTQNTQKQPLSQTSKEQPDNTHLKTRTKSQTTQLKSLKKTNQLITQKQEEQKKSQRLKQITKRKLQLMQRLKKIDVELQQAKRQASPYMVKQEKEKSLYQSNLNRSFIQNLSNSKMNRQGSQNVVEQHSKVVEVLERINNQKIRRQEKIADQFRKKQQAELIKLQEMERKRNQQLQQKNKRNQVAIQRLKKQNKVKKVNQAKLNQFPQKIQSSLLPTTMIKSRNQRNSLKDGLFFEQKSSHNLLTQRDFDIDAEQHGKQFDKAITSEVMKQQKKIQQQLSQSIVKQQNQQNPNKQQIQDNNITQFTLNPNIQIQDQHHLIA